MAMAAMNMVSAGAFRGELSFKKMSAGGRLCTLQENAHFWAPTIKFRPPDGSSVVLKLISSSGKYQILPLYFFNLGTCPATLIDAKFENFCHLFWFIQT
jgi:hypothetical protein